MNKLSREQVLEIVKLVVIGICVAAVVITALRIFWPLLLVAVLYFAYRIYRNRKEMKQFTNAATSQMEKDLFYEQVRKRKENAEIIDAEFTESKDSAQEEHQ